VQFGAERKITRRHPQDDREEVKGMVTEDRTFLLKKPPQLSAEAVL
jgi:hypothetical protein